MLRDGGPWWEWTPGGAFCQVTRGGRDGVELPGGAFGKFYKTTILCCMESVKKIPSYPQLRGKYRKITLSPQLWEKCRKITLSPQLWEKWRKITLSPPLSEELKNYSPLPEIWGEELFALFYYSGFPVFSFFYATF